MKNTPTLTEKRRVKLLKQILNNRAIGLRCKGLCAMILFLPYSKVKNIETIMKFSQQNKFTHVRNTLAKLKKEVIMGNEGVNVNIKKNDEVTLKVTFFTQKHKFIISPLSNNRGILNRERKK